MTIAPAGARIAGTAGHGEQRQYRTGDRVSFTVVQRLAEQRYLASFANVQRVVGSNVPLTVGSVVRATVTAAGDRLELQYVGTDQVAAAMSEHEAKSEDALTAFAARYAVELTQPQHAALREAIDTADDKDAVAMAGLYLSKLSLPVDDAGIRAIREAQAWTTSLTSGRDAASRIAENAADELAVLISGAMGPEQLAAVSQEGVPVQLPLGANLKDMRDQENQRDLRQRLLNEQDEGSVAHCYGTLPVIVGDQLVELDLVHFRERGGSQGSHESRRMVMSLQTASLGKIEVVAQALGERLSIDIRTESAAASQSLAAHATEVRELAARLGWSVDAVSYNLGPVSTRAARHIVDHVLNAGTLSRWV